MNNRLLGSSSRHCRSRLELYFPGPIVSRFRLLTYFFHDSFRSVLPITSLRPKGVANQTTSIHVVFACSDLSSEFEQYATSHSQAKQCQLCESSYSSSRSINEPSSMNKLPVCLFDNFFQTCVSDAENCGWAKVDSQKVLRRSERILLEMYVGFFPIIRSCMCLTTFRRFLPRSGPTSQSCASTDETIGRRSMTGLVLLDAHRRSPIGGHSSCIPW